MYAFFHESELGSNCQGIQDREDRLEKASIQCGRGSVEYFPVEPETGRYFPVEPETGRYRVLWNNSGTQPADFRGRWQNDCNLYNIEVQTFLGGNCRVAGLKQ